MEHSLGSSRYKRRMYRDPDVDVSTSSKWRGGFGSTEGLPHMRVRLQPDARKQERKKPRIETVNITTTLCGDTLDFIKQLSLRTEGPDGEELPNEVMLNIFSHLPAKDVVNVKRVCTRWYSLADDDQLWRSICSRTFQIDWTEEQVRRNQYRWQDYFKELKQREKDLELSYYVEGDPGVPVLQDGEPVLGCRHYRRNNKMFAECCKRFFVCRHCHNEAQDHEINRYHVKTMYCMLCRTIQPISGTCKSSICNGKSIARYFCAFCNFHDDAPEKEIYHCPTCNVCYCGKGLGIDYFHCEECNLCFLLQYRDTHKHIFKKKPDGHE